MDNAPRGAPDAVRSAAPEPAWLDVRQLAAGYAGRPVLEGVSLQVSPGEIVGVIGPNGAGKTTLLRVMSGLVRPTSGEIWFKGQRIDGLSPRQVLTRGIAHIPEGRHLFPFMSVEDNLRMGAYIHSRTEARGGIVRAGRRFPILAQRLRQHAGSLSGGEQQMVAIARGLMATPQLLLLDEPSIGLGPRVVTELGAIIGDLVAQGGHAAILVEQNARFALRVASRAYVLELGRVAIAGASEQLQHESRVQSAYLSS